MMKLIQFLSPSRPVVVYCQFHEASTRREGGREGGTSLMEMYVFIMC